MKYVELFKKFDSKNRPVNVVYFGRDYHALKQLSKEIELTHIGEGKCFYNKVRMTAVTPNDDANIMTANLKIDAIVVDTHSDEHILRFIESKLGENPKVKIISSFDNKKIKDSLHLKTRKKEYFEYYR